MAEAGDKGAAVSQEQALLETARRIVIAKPAGGWACHIHLSRLAPQRLKDNLSFAVNMLRASVDRFLGRTFILENSDIVVICWQARLWQLRSAIASLKPLFETDGRGRVYSVHEPSFATWYDLDQQSGEFQLLAERLVSPQSDRFHEPRTAVARWSEAAAEPAERGRLDPVKLAGLVARIKDANLAGAIRKQPICRLTAAGRHTVMEEVYVSIAELQRLFAPRLDLGLDRWLFRALTEILDGRVLSWLAAADALSIISNFAVNLNLSTIVSGELARFEARTGNQLRELMVIEIEKADLLSDLALFAKVRESLRQRGYGLCIDGLTGPDLAAIDYGRFDADFYKVVWHPELTEEGQEGRVGLDRLVAQASSERVILSHCGVSQAVEWGQSVGIKMFQGWHVDALMRLAQPSMLRLVAGN